MCALLLENLSKREECSVYLSVVKIEPPVSVGWLKMESPKHPLN
jgi:hypothetical protein